MEKNLEEIRLPHYGMITAIAKEACVSRPTATYALRYNTRGPKAELCRKIYFEKYANL